MKDEPLLFRFAHATDLHYETANPPQEALANSRFSCLIDDLNQVNKTSPLDFAILSGDLSNCGAANQADLVGAKQLCEGLDMAYHAIAGNHDLAPHRECAAAYPGKEDYHEGPMATSNYASVFGEERLKFSFEEQGYHFVGVSLRDEDPDDMLDWLAAELDRIPGRGIVVAHYGLYPARQEGRLRTWGFQRIGKILPRLRSMIDAARPRIVAYLYGHNHVNSVVKQGEVYHMSAGGIQKGCTGYRLFDCYENRIETNYHLISDPSLRHFRNWPFDAAAVGPESAHTTADMYHLGSPAEQSLTLNVPPAP